LDHPNIVPIYEAGEADGQLFIAMRYVLGSDLKGLLTDQGGQLPVRATLELFSQVADALDSAHGAGLVHRDVKPGNILVASGERPRHAHGDHVYLTDFGLTKRTSELTGGLTGTGRFLGTVDYVSPEQIQGRPVGASTDIYALGCVLYECLTGQLPFRRDDDAGLLWAHLVEAPPPVTAIRPELPAAVNAVVARAMAKEPADRYESCEELLRELEAAFDGPDATAPPAGRGRSTTTLSRDGREGAGEGYSLAIDLGTSFIAAAVADDRGLEMFSLGDGALVAPAAVYVRGDGQLLTCEAAARRAVSHPDRFAREIKRNLGNPTPVMLGGSPFAVTNLLSALLQDVLVRVTDRQGAKPGAVVLTHPANWGPFRRELFEDVAESAGLSDPLYTTEPEAAAAHYASTRPLADGEVIAVYDLGGGTFDATVLVRTEQGFEIAGTPEGIERLGGADFDDAIFAHVNYLAGGALRELDLGDPRIVVALAQLRQDCTMAKEALSVDAEATIPVFLPNRHFEVTLTRLELEGMIRASIESTIQTLDRVLRAAQVDRTELAAILLVGGSSRIPLVAQMVSEAFGRPTVVGAHPKHAVALGAALIAEASRTSTPVARAAGDTRRETRTTTVGESPPTRLEAPAWTTSHTGAGAPVRGPAGPPDPAPAAATPSAATPSAAAAVALVPHGDVPALPGVEPAGPVPAPRAGEPTGPGPDAGGAGPALPPSTGPAGGPPEGPPPPPTARRRNRWIALVVGLLVLAAAGAGVLVYRNLGPGPQTRSTSAPTSKPAPPSQPTAPTATAVAPAVPIPSLGTPITVGRAPNFVVASPSGRQLYIADPVAGVVTVVDTAVNTVTGQITITAGPPRFLAFSPDGSKVYVSVYKDDKSGPAVSVLDTRTNQIVATIAVQTRPFLAAVTRDGNLVYVPNHDTGTIQVIDARTLKPVADFHVPANPHSAALTPDGTRLYIADHESNVVSVVETSDNKVLTTIPVPPSPHNVAVHPTRPLAIVASYDAQSVTAIDTSTNKAISTIHVGVNPQHIAYSADGRFAYVTNDGSNNVSVLELQSFTVTATIPTGRGPTSVAVLPNGKQAYVSNVDDGTLTVLDVAG
jgi:YVTN family beta-propeller protein